MKNTFSGLGQSVDTLHVSLFHFGNDTNGVSARFAWNN